jgi:hypothetical protein
MKVPKTLQIQFVKTIQLMKTSCNKVIFHLLVMYLALENKNKSHNSFMGTNI